MKKFAALLLLVLACALNVFGQYTPPTGGVDTYQGLNNVPCTNSNTAFSLAQVSNNLVLCTPAGHAYWFKSFFTFDNGIGGSGTSGDELSNSYGSYTTTKYTTQQKWADRSIARFLTWGFTGLAVGRATSVTNPWATANPVPFIAGADIAHYATYNPQGYSSSCMPKDLMSTIKTTGWGGFTSTGSLTDFNDSCWQTYYTAYLNGDVAFAVGGQSTAMKHYLIAVADCDADNCHGFGAGPDFVPANSNYDFRLGYMSVFLPPTKYGDTASPQAYQDGTIYAKKVWHDQAVLRGTISTINTAYSSSYTTDLTSGTCFGTLHPSWLCPSPSAALSIGTGNGTALSFSGTAANTTLSKWSVYVAKASTIVGGDQGTGTPAAISGPLLQKAITAGATNGSPTVTCTSCTTFVTGGLWNGANISLNGTVYTISTVGSTSSLTLTSNYTGSTSTAITMLTNFVNYTTGAVSVMFSSANAPANGNAITVGYIQNGYGIGTGMMDENCPAGHASYCGNGGGNASEFFTGVNTNLASDLNQVSKTTAKNYATFAENAIAGWASAKGFTGKVMHAGIYALGSWGAPPDKYVLQGLSGLQDIIIASGSGNGFSHWNQSMLDYVQANMGNAAIIESSYRTSNRDSPFAYVSSPTTGSGTTATATLTTPIKLTTGVLIDTFCTNTAFNRLQIHPASVNTGTGVVTWTTSGTVSGSTTCNVAYSDNNEGGFSSQNARGLDFKADITAAPQTAYTSSSIHPFIGVIQWAWQDYWNELLNWGIVTFRDNPYNGIDDNGPSTFTCQAPDNSAPNSFTCGGELASHTANGAIGDYIDPVGLGLTAVDTYLLGLITGTSTGTVSGTGTISGTGVVSVNP